MNRDEVLQIFGETKQISNRINEKRRIKGWMDRSERASMRNLPFLYKPLSSDRTILSG